MAFRLGCVCGGLRAGSAPGTLLPEDPFPAEGPRAWTGGSPSMTGKTKPLPGHCPIWRKFWRGGVLSPGPLPPHPRCPQSGMVGEVANRFPGQHRGRLGWSSGQWRARSYPAHPHPISLGLRPAQPNAAPFGPADLSAPLPFCLLKPRQPW